MHPIKASGSSEERLQISTCPPHRGHLLYPPREYTYGSTPVGEYTYMYSLSRHTPSSRTTAEGGDRGVQGSTRSQKFSRCPSVTPSQAVMTAPICDPMIPPKLLMDMMVAYSVPSMPCRETRGRRQRSDTDAERNTRATATIHVRSTTTTSNPHEHISRSRGNARGRDGGFADAPPGRAERRGPALASCRSIRRSRGLRSRPGRTPAAVQSHRLSVNVSFSLSLKEGGVPAQLAGRAPGGSDSRYTKAWL